MPKPSRVMRVSGLIGLTVVVAAAVAATIATTPVPQAGGSRGARRSACPRQRHGTPPARRVLPAVPRDVSQGNDDRGRDPDVRRQIRRRFRPCARDADPRIGWQPESHIDRRRRRLLPSDAGDVPRAAGRYQHRGRYQVPRTDGPPVRARGLRCRGVQRRPRPRAPWPTAAGNAAVRALRRGLSQRAQAARRLGASSRRDDRARTDP